MLIQDSWTTAVNEALLLKTGARILEEGWGFAEVPGELRSIKGAIID